ncbi:Ig-like domain-containing protein [Ideonella paludis]|uniref:Ig-like domain-containing protein n=1 Tax=Ideonella paludis TaxID=1233411 RepID=UPI00363BCD07
MTLDVGGVNDAPVAQADVGSTTEDAVLTVSAANGVIQSGAAPAGRDSDVDGDSLAVSAVSFGNTVGKVGSPIAGAFGTLTLNADGSYSYVPNAAAQALDTGESDRDIFTYTVTDPAGKTATTTLTITVTGVNDGPVAIDDSALTPVGTPVTIPVLGNDTDPDGEPLTVTQVDGKPISPGNPVSLTDPVGNPIGTVALNPDGTLTFTPAPGYEGPVDFPYTVTDGTTTDTANVHIVVSDNNRPPQAGDNVVDGQEDTPVTFDPRSNDFDPDTDPLTITEINGQPIEPGQSVDLPQGKVSMNPDGTLTFTPKDNFTGPVTFDYTVEDGRGGSDVAQVTINVANTNDLPEGTDNTRGTAEDTAYVLKTEDFGFKDVDGDTFAGVRIDKVPTAGTLTLNGQAVAAGQFVSAQDIADGKLQYVPAANENGRPYGSFDFSVQDSQGSFDAKPNTFTLNVGELDDSPSAVNDTATTAEDTAVIVDVLKNDSDPDKEDTLSIVAIDGQPAVVGQPVSISKDGVVIATVTLTADGKLSVLPAPNYNTEGRADHLRLHHHRRAHRGEGQGRGRGHAGE